MGLDDVVTWYQKKIGTYDKQPWEKTVEQRILHGLTHIPMKTAKLKTDYIDVDLVRGSSFPKAKPKHGFMTVARLGTLRLFLLPLYAKWWIQQTSPPIFGLLLTLYLLEMANTAIYSVHSNDIVVEKQIDGNNYFQQPLPISEIIVPVIMMLILSIIHSQIVSTNPGPDRPKSSSKSAYLKSRKLKSRRRKINRSPHLTMPLVNARLDPNEHDLEAMLPPYSDKKLVNPPLNDGYNSKQVAPPVQSCEATTLLKQKSEEKIIVVPKRNVAWEDLPDQRNIGVASKETSHNKDIKEDSPLIQLDDDGFESLNGNGSSENSVESPLVTPTPIQKEPAFVHPPTTKNIESTPAIVPDGKDKCEAWMQNIEIVRTFTNRRPSAPVENDSDSGPDLIRRENFHERKASLLNLHIPKNTIESSGCDSEEGEYEMSRPGDAISSCCPLLTEATTSATEWIGVTTNSEDCTYSSEYDESDSHSEFNNSSLDQSTHWDYDLAPTAILNTGCVSSDKVSCTIWTRHDVKKADLTVLDISSAIIERVEAMPETLDYFYSGIFLSIFLACIPAFCRLGWGILEAHAMNQTQISIGEFLGIIYDEPMSMLMQFALGSTHWERVLMMISIFQRCVLGSFFFFLLAVAERTFKQRFLYAKLFLHLTSSRRARKSNLPHFRLNKVRNIKTWLSVRSYLKKRGPQRSVDMIVSAAFIITLLLLSFICIELLKDSIALHSQYNLEVMFWSFSIGVYILRFMTLGAKINRKYRNLSVLITEQINLYLQIEQKPQKKDQLNVANSVLKLASDLIKELESPFKISGLSANPYLYTITKVVILSALSGVLSEMLGFKLKLFKMKFK